jgi:hypothetical protein
MAKSPDGKWTSDATDDIRRRTASGLKRRPNRADAPPDLTMTIYDATKPFISVDFLPRSGAPTVDYRPSSCPGGSEQYLIRDQPARLGAVIY